MALTQQHIDAIFKSLVDATRDYHNLMYLASDNTIRFSKVGTFESWHDYILLDHSSKDRIVVSYQLVNAFNRVYNDLMQQSSTFCMNQIFLSLRYNYYDACYIERDHGSSPDYTAKCVKLFNKIFPKFIKRYTDFVVKYQELALLEEVNNL